MTNEKAGEPRRAWGLWIAWLALGVVLLVSVTVGVWQFFGSNQLAANRAEAILDDFEADCAESAAVAVLEMPSISDRKYPVLAGTTRHELSRGVGWYQQSAEPGETGNTVLTGYRLTNGEPFRDLLDLAEGDEVTLTTCGATHRYEVVVAPKDLTVDVDDSWVMDAVPGEPSQLPTAPMLTLVTNQDLLPTADRAVGFARYVGS